MVRDCRPTRRRVASRGCGVLVLTVNRILISSLPKWKTCLTSIGIESKVKPIFFGDYRPVWGLPAVTNPIRWKLSSCNIFTVCGVKYEMKQINPFLLPLIRLGILFLSQNYTIKHGQKPCQSAHPIVFNVYILATKLEKGQICWMKGGRCTWWISWSLVN